MDNISLQDVATGLAASSEVNDAINEVIKKNEQSVGNNSLEGVAKSNLRETDEAPEVFVFALHSTGAGNDSSEKNLSSDVKSNISPKNKLNDFLSSKNQQYKQSFLKPLEPLHQQKLMECLEQFFLKWKVHGKEQVQAKAYVVLQHFLLVVVSPHVKPSGCAKDELFSTVKRAAATIDAKLVSGSNILYAPEVFSKNNTGSSIGKKSISNDAVRLLECERFMLPKLIGANEITAETLIFNLGVRSLDELNSNFCVPAMRGWLASSF